MRFLILLTLFAPAARAAPDPGGTAALGLYPVVLEGRAGFMDRAGQVAIPCTYDSVSEFSEGRARVKLGVVSKNGALSGGRYGFIDAKGAVAIPATFDYAHNFSEGLAAARGDDRRYGYLDPSGAWAIPPRFDGRAGRFSEGLAGVELPGRRYGFIDRAGRLVFQVPPDSDTGDPPRFQEGHAAVEFRRSRADRGTRYLDRKGAVVLEIPHPIARSVSDGLIAVRVTAKKTWGFMDLRGKWVLPPTWAFAWGFRDGRAQVTLDDGRKALIDRTGAVVWSTAEERPGGLREGLIRFRRAAVTPVSGN